MSVFACLQGIISPVITQRFSLIYILCSQTHWTDYFFSLHSLVWTGHILRLCSIYFKVLLMILLTLQGSHIISGRESMCVKKLC